MKIKDSSKLRTELELMLKHKWNCLNQLLVPELIKDIVTFIETYKNERTPDESRRN